jgi:hypothetical protein
MTTGTSRIVPPLAFAGALAALGLLVASASGVSLVSRNPIKVWGRVTYNGNPVTDAIIIFVSSEGFVGRSALAQVGPDGSYAMTMYQAKDLEPGRYDIFLLNRQPPRRSRVARLGAGSAEAGGRASSGAVASPPERRLPTRFTNPRTSDLSLMIRDGRCRIDIDLKD